MKKNKNVSLSKKSFWSFLTQKEQKIEIAIYCTFFVILFFILKIMYPYPDGLTDSGSYIAAAMKGKYDGFRPYGYSGFLNFVKSISDSISFVVFTQYFFHAITSILFILTVKYFFNTQKKYIYYTFVAVSLLSISSLYLTNTIMSDSIFASLSVSWVMLSLWLVNIQSKAGQIILLAAKFLILYYLISIRFTGVVYFVMELILVFFLLFKKRKGLLAISSLVIILIYFGFYKKQVELSKEVTGIEVFSGFSGWQLANNALHALPYIELDESDFKNKPFREFILYAKSADSLLDVNVAKERTVTRFMWGKQMPLKQYLFYKQNMYKWHYIKMWSYLGKEVYSKFGKYIILKYPWSYCKHFLLPNTLGVLYPTRDPLFTEYSTSAMPPHVLKDYYKIPQNQKFHANSNFVANCSKAFATYRLILWILIFILVIAFMIQRSWGKIQKNQLHVALFVFIFVMGYVAFHILTTPFELRYITPLHLCQTFLLYIGLYSLVKREDKNEVMAS